MSWLSFHKQRLTNVMFPSCWARPSADFVYLALQHAALTRESMHVSFLPEMLASCIMPDNQLRHHWKKRLSVTSMIMVLHETRYDVVVALLRSQQVGPHA